MIKQVLKDIYYKQYQKNISDVELDLLCESICSLNWDNNWLQPELLSHRLSYIFEPKFTNDYSKLVFVTKLLFLRDILENKQIHSSIHKPFTLLTLPFSYFLFQHYSIHIVIDHDIFKAINDKAVFRYIGSVIPIETKFCLKLSTESIVDINYYGPSDMQNVFDNVISQTLVKSASRKEISPFGREETLYLSEDHKNILPGNKVKHKQTNESCIVKLIELGPPGKILLNCGVQDIYVDLIDFDRYFVVDS